MGACEHGKAREEIEERTRITHLLEVKENGEAEP
jgi:hypothetical protein